MLRTRVYLFNVLSWLVGAAIVGVGAWALDKWLPHSILRSFLEWLLVAIAVSVFGGVSILAMRRDREREEV